MAKKQNDDVQSTESIPDLKAPPVDANEYVISTGNFTDVTSSAILNKDVIPVGIFKLNPDAQIPEYSTDGSMCFDIRACVSYDTIIGYNCLNQKKTFITGIFNRETLARGFSLEPGDRALVPTGLIFDLPEGTALLLYPRSGLSLKQGLKLGNCVAVIDYDYVDQTYVILENTSDVRELILNGDRICQGEVVATPPRALFKQLNSNPSQKTNRSGGLGSTGKK